MLGSVRNNKKHHGREGSYHYQDFHAIQVHQIYNADTDLTFEGNIARVLLYKEMCIPENVKAVWWEQMKNYVRKKMDERHPNCGAAIKKSILSKYKMALSGHNSSFF